jgi:hypothetical protein
VSRPKFVDLTDQELAALSEEDLEFYVDRECADRGVPFPPPHPGAAPKATPLAHDVTYYSLGGLMFAERADAERVARALDESRLVKTAYAPGGTYEDMIVEASEMPGISVERGISREEWARVRPLAAKLKQVVADHKKALVAYEEAAEKRNEVESEMLGLVDAARSRESKRTAFIVELARYKELADGNETLALRFLLRAHPDAKEYVDGTSGLGAALAAIES